MLNPIIHREFFALLRSRRSLAVLVALAASLSGLVLLYWPSGERSNAAQAAELLRIFGYGLLTGMILLAPAFPATSLVRERRQGTLALLLNSPMSPWSILLGKIGGSMGFVVLLLLMSLPAAAACFAMGGVSLEHQLWPLYLIILLVGLQYTVIGLWVSSFVGNTDSALRLTYGVILAVAVGAVIPWYFFRGMIPDYLAGLTAVLDLVRSISPLPAIMEIMGQGDVGGRGLIWHGQPVLQFTILSLTISALLATWTGLRLNSRMFDRPRAAGRVTDERSTAVQAYRRIMYMWFFDPQRRTGLIGPLTNPVTVKEFRSRRFGRSNWMMRLIAVSALLSLGLALFSTQTMQWRMEQEEGASVLGSLIVLLQVALIVLLTPSLAAGLISTERESGGWQLLQLTPLSPVTIVVGKLLSVAWTMLLLLLATLPGYAVLLIIDETQKARVLRVLLTLVLTAVFSLLLSAAVSSCFRRTAAATATAYALLVSLCAGTILFWLGEGAPFTHGLVESVLRINPLAAALALIETRGFTSYQLLPYNWWIMGGGSVLCLLVLLVQTWKLTKPR